MLERVIILRDHFIQLHFAREKKKKKREEGVEYSDLMLITLLAIQERGKSYVVPGSLDRQPGEVPNAVLLPGSLN